MTRKEQIKSAYRQLGGSASFYDGMMCKPFTRKYVDPAAPYDGYVEDNDTEEGARSSILGKVGRSET